MEKPATDREAPHRPGRLAAIVLAAGAGRRMGGLSKALIRVDGVPLIRRHVDLLQTIGVDEVVVVTGHAHHDVTAAIDGYRVTVTFNPVHPQGRQSSVRAGLEALHDAREDAYRAVLIVLVDQPLIGAPDLHELLAAFAARSHGHVLVPFVGGQRGNPVVLDGKALGLVLASAPLLGVRDLLDRDPAHVYAHVTDNRHFIRDLDTREDIEALTAETGMRVETTGD